MNILRMSLLVNTVFSTLTGLVLLLFTDNVVELFSLTKGTVFIIIGIGLLLFAFTVGIEINRQRLKKVNLIIIQIGLISYFDKIDDIIIPELT